MHEPSHYFVFIIIFISVNKLLKQMTTANNKTLNSKQESAIRNYSILEKADL